jgi:hypothetical protein
VLFARELRLDNRVEIAAQTPELFDAALDLYERRPDKTQPDGLHVDGALQDARDN